jgi:hypothetical protein
MTGIEKEMPKNEYKQFYAISRLTIIEKKFNGAEEIIVFVFYRGQTYLCPQLH